MNKYSHSVDFLLVGRGICFQPAVCFLPVL